MATSIYQVYQDGRNDCLTDRQIENKLKKAEKEGKPVYVKQVVPGYVVLMIADKGNKSSLPKLSKDEAWAEIKRLRILGEQQC